MVDQDGTSSVSVGAGIGPMFRFVTAQLSVAGLPTGAGGASVLELTVTDVEEVQPVIVLVINKV